MPVSARINPTPPAPEPKPLAPEAQERVARVEQDGAIAVPERLRQLHALIAEHEQEQEQEQRRRESKRDRSAWGPTFTEWTDSDHRKAERLRHIEKERRQKERDQWRRFGEFAQRWRDAARVRQFLSALEVQAHDPQQ